MKLEQLNLAALLRQPLGNGDEVAAGPDSASPLAWRREMERAQADAWFHEALRQRQHHEEGNAPPPIAERPGHRVAAPIAERAGHRLAVPIDGRPNDGATGMHSVVEAVTHPHPMVTPTAQQPASIQWAALDAAKAASPSLPNVAMPHLAAATLGEPAEPDTLHALANAPALPLNGAVSLTMLEAAPIEHAAGSAAPARSAARPADDNRLPVRVHVEGDSQRATVWLGVNAAARLQLPALTEAIGRWLAQAGYGVPTFICNGRLVDDNSRDLPPEIEQARGDAPAIPAFTIEHIQGESS